MKFHELDLHGACWIEIELKEDERGFFARSFCEREFIGQGMPIHFPQCNISFNKKRGTLRGIHYSVQPCAEAKLIRCTQGAVYDVLVDLRAHSSSYLKWVSVKLTSENRKILFVPEGIAHGYQTLEDNTEIFYHMSVPYDGSCARGIRWDDPALRIEWPISNPILSQKDTEFPNIV